MIKEQMQDSISVKGARVNNLKNISLEIPRNKLVVITGVSGSGKSSLAFDTLFAEGQRRFAQSLSSYARQFLGRMSKPDVDLIDGIPPAVAIEQKVNIKNPRSTVATTTEIYDYLRIVFARAGHTFSPISGREVTRDSVSTVMQYIDAQPAREGYLYICCDPGWNSCEDRVALLLQLKEQGYSRLLAGYQVVKIDDALQNGISDVALQHGAGESPLQGGAAEAGGISGSQLQGTAAETNDTVQNVLLLVDRVNLATKDTDRDRVLSSVSDAFRRGDGKMLLLGQGLANSSAGTPAAAIQSTQTAAEAIQSNQTAAAAIQDTQTAAAASQGTPATATQAPIGKIEFSEKFELDGITFAVPDEYMFSFNSPLGACPVCGGLGKIIGISEDLVVPDKSKSIYDGAIACWRGDKMGWFKDHLVELAAKKDIPIFTPYCELPQRVKDLIWEGERPAPGAEYDDDPERLIGINEFFEWVQTQRYKIQFKYMLSRFSGKTVCHECHGSRLRKDALYVRVGGRNIDELLNMNVDDLLAWMQALKLPQGDSEIVKEPLAELVSRLQCLQDVGLGYLTLNRACNTLSGGESQRVNLVTALGSSLVGSMYILDEPSIGLHSRDTQRLISVLKRLRDLGNTVIVVEHDEEIIKAADLTIELGPRAGLYGGGIVPAKDSLTAKYISGEIRRYKRGIRSWNYSIDVLGAHEHNLKGIDVKFPLGVLTVVTGVSGSGKSSLVGDILYPALFRRLNDSGDLPGVFKGLGGNLDRIQRVEYVDQNPIGKSSRSNAVTYLKAYDDIRELFAQQQYARINGYTPQFFSFNADGGRCPECQGEGVVTIEMQFMADVTMVCEECGGKRFKPDILEVRYRGKNIDDVLNMSVDEAIEFFAGGTEPEAASVAAKLQPLQDVGLGYIKLGQSSATLSGGESQRIKLAYFLAMSKAGKKAEKIMFIFDEPTTGLHFFDVEKLLKAFDQLLSRGHSLVVVEHNPDVIRNADWVIDLGPDAGENGGELCFEGTPSQLEVADTFTARYIFGK